MTVFDLRTWQGDQSISPSVGAIPYIEIDQESLQYTAQRISFDATVFDPITGEPIYAQYIANGSFSGFFTPAFAKSRITSINLATQGLGALAVTGFNVSASDTQDINRFSELLFASDDTYHGGVSDATVDLGRGNDVIYAGDGRDRLVGGLGIDQAYGEGGDDIFVMRNAASPTWFRKGKTPASGVILDMKKRKAGRRKKKFFLMDTDYLICSDFDINADSIAFEGVDGSTLSVEYAPAGNPGIMYVLPDGNILGYFPGISMDVYDASGGLFEVG